MATSTMPEKDMRWLFLRRLNIASSVCISNDSGRLMVSRLSAPVVSFCTSFARLLAQLSQMKYSALKRHCILNNTAFAWFGYLTFKGR